MQPAKQLPGSPSFLPHTARRSPPLAARVSLSVSHKVPVPHRPQDHSRIPDLASASGNPPVLAKKSHGRTPAWTGAKGVASAQSNNVVAPTAIKPRAHDGCTSLFSIASADHVSAGVN